MYTPFYRDSFRTGQTSSGYCLVNSAKQTYLCAKKMSFMPGKKWYVVWKGVTPGVYHSWEECKLQVQGFENALYKSFGSEKEARDAFATAVPGRFFAKKEKIVVSAPGAIIPDSLSVDAACSGNPGRMEYRGVYTATGEEIFRSPCFEEGTNNIGEFLALVHGLALLKKRESSIPVYSDSVNAIKWVREKRCKTKLERNAKNNSLFDLIERAEKWLRTNSYTTPILKWETRSWGEIPADFGRK